MLKVNDFTQHYDQDFWFFQKVLDPTLTYSCADWIGNNNLYEAQVSKLDRLLHFAGVTGETNQLLDVGCGWGSMMRHALARYPTLHRIVGITVTPSQVAFCHENLPKPWFEVIESDIFDCFDEDHLGIQKHGKFDSAVSIGSLEHFSNAKEYKAGMHIEKYRRFFNGMRSLVSGKVALQTIVTTRKADKTNVSEFRKSVKLLRHISKTIFPNSLSPPLEDVQAALENIYKIERQEVNHTDYANTLKTWSSNLDGIKSEIGNDSYQRYKKYFDLTAEQYESGNLAIARFSLQPLCN